MLLGERGDERGRRGVSDLLADHLVAMRDGRFVAEGAPAAIVDAALVWEVFDPPCVLAPDPVTGTPMIVPTADHAGPGLRETAPAAVRDGLAGPQVP